MDLVTTCDSPSFTNHPFYRTSGEVRLSDFLLWQSCESVVYFTPVLWPDFSVRQLLMAVFQYQRQRMTGREEVAEGTPQQKDDLDEQEVKSAERIKRFLLWMREREERRAMSS